MKRKIVTLIGTRYPNEEYKQLMIRIGKAFSDRGYGARSGGAIGSDTLFLTEYDPTLTIVYRPDDRPGCVNVKNHENYYEFELLASRVHGSGVGWEFMPIGHQELHARNVPQVMGLNLKSYSDLVVFCAEESIHGTVSGGTATAVKIARSLNIPTLNIMNPVQRSKLCTWLGIDDIPVLEKVDIFNL